MKKVLSIALICIMMLVPVYANASGGISVTDKVEMDNIVISGVLPVWEGTDVTLVVLNINADISQVTNDNIKEIIKYQNQTKADADGKFTFDFVMVGNKGTYSYFIEADGYKINYTDTFDYAGSGYVLELLGYINTAKRESKPIDIKGYVEDNITTFGITQGHYTNLIANTNNDDELYGIIAKMPEVNLAQDLRKQLEDAAVLLNIKYSADGVAAQSKINLLKDELTLTEDTAYKTYCDTTILTSGQQAEIAGKYVGKDYYSVGDFVDAFHIDVILTAANTSQSYGELQRALISNKDIIGFTKMSEYENLKYKEKVFIELFGTQFADIEDIRDKVDEAILAEKEKEKIQEEEKEDTTSPGSPGGFPQSFAPAEIVTEQTSTEKLENKGFNDMKNFEWADVAVNAMYAKGIVNGTGNSQFSPEREVTREEFIKMLIMSFEMFDTDATVNFADVAENEWYYPYIASAVKNGIVLGVAGDAFGTGQKISREDMAIIAYRALAVSEFEMSESADAESFSDFAEVSDYACDAVEALSANGIINGMGDGTFAPKEYSNRAQAAVIIYRLMGLLNKI